MVLEEVCGRTPGRDGDSVRGIQSCSGDVVRCCQRKSAFWRRAPMLPEEVCGRRAPAGETDAKSRIVEVGAPATAVAWRSARCPLQSRSGDVVRCEEVCDGERLQGRRRKSGIVEVGAPSAAVACSPLQSHLVLTLESSGNKISEVEELPQRDCGCKVWGSEFWKLRTWAC
ncbi:hypothetical protein BS78_05G213700 [Paspalum vaginatum]|nr:hypothetical protein BS78_05G213700 [Paspalum vaginatum]